MKTKIFFTIFAILFLINESAFARAGGRSSGFGGGRSSSSYSNQGSRGSRTYDGGNSNGKSYSGMDKSTTSKPSTSPNQNTNGQNNQQANNNQNASPSFFQRHPMLSTFGAAMAGSWLGSMLFGGMGGGAGMMGGSGTGAGGGFFSGIIPIILIGLLVWFVIRMVNRNNASGSSRGNVFNGNNSQNTDQNYSGSNQNIQANTRANTQASQDIQLPESEKQRFSEILVEVQSAWSDQDMERLKRSVTPEILKYFSDALHQNQSQDLQNKVENIKVLSVIISESWEEEELQFSTVILEWSALDYSINIGKNIDDPMYVSEGDMKNQTTISEAWTLVRFGWQGKWILSAIAQIN